MNIDPTVERVARAMAARRGRNPDEMIPETGRQGARMIPRWHFEIEWAERHVIAHRILKEGESA